MPSLTRSVFVFLVSFGGAVQVFAAPVITLTPDKADGVYQTGEKVSWTVKVTGDEAAPVREAVYVLNKGGATEIGKGTLKFDRGVATLEATLNEPGTILAEVTLPGQKSVRGLGGAAVAPEKIVRSAPCPDDFDAFWQSKVKEVKAVPANPVLEPGDSGKPGVDYWKLTLDNIRATHIHGQLARPAGDRKCPAMLVVQWAGVYPLRKNWAIDPAAAGWLVLNIEAHDVPIDAPASFYDAQRAGPLANYTSIGIQDRDTSYFVRMFMACVQAVDYLATRPDWDGKTIIVTGASQGGIQSFVSAALDPKVTGIMVCVPAGCDHTGASLGRRPGWPFYLGHPKPDQAAELKTLGYFDGVNFAARIKCPALIGVGLIDETAPPTGVFAAVNQMQGPKEVVVLATSDHNTNPKAQQPYFNRVSKLEKALVATGVTDVRTGYNAGLK